MKVLDWVNNTTQNCNEKACKAPTSTCMTKGKLNEFAIEQFSKDSATTTSTTATVTTGNFQT